MTDMIVGGLLILGVAVGIVSLGILIFFVACYLIGRE